MCFEIPQLKYSCCGCSLKTGSTIIGWVDLIIGIVTTLVLFNDLIQFLEKYPKKMDPKDKTNEPTPDMIVMVTIVLMVLYIIGCAIDIILLLGIYRNKAKLVFIAIVAYLTVLIITTGFSVIQLIITQDLRDIMSYVISTLLSIYFLLVLYSYYRESNGPTDNV